MIIEDIVTKDIESTLVVCIEEYRGSEEIERDIDKLYEFLYRNNLQSKISGNAIVVFLSEKNDCLVCVPVSEEVKTENGILMWRLPQIRCFSIVHTTGPKTLKSSIARLKEYKTMQNSPWKYPIREVFIPSPDGERGFLIEIQAPV